MTKTIFRNTFIIGILVLGLCAVIFFGMHYNNTKNETYEELKQESEYAVQGLMLNGNDYLSKLGSVNQITWISESGEVLFDNLDSATAVDPSDYPEVESALSTGEGHSIRESAISGENTMYYARLCDDGTVLRLSRPISAIEDALAAVSPILWVLVLLILVSAVLSFRFSRQIVKPINEINLDDPDPNIYSELSPLIERLREQKLTIQEEVAQRELMRREFSANVSHELKTPLTSISGFAELLSQGIVPEEKVREFAADIYKESQRMITLVDDIIKISQLDENAVEPAWETVDLYDLASDVLDTLRPVADKQNVTVQLSGDHANVAGVYRLLHEMIYNLCDNAIKYNLPGGKLDVTVSSSCKSALITVADTGIGIPKEHQSRVFERFYRVDKSHSKEIGGTGLGLSIVKHGAQFHNASVALESKPGEGTAVTLTFPAL